MKNRKPARKPVSATLVTGVVLLIISLAGLGWAAVSNALSKVPPSGLLRHLQTWKVAIVLCVIVIFIGLIRTAVLRYQAAAVKKAKDEAGLLGEQQAAAELTKLGSGYHTLNRFFLHHKGRTHEFDHVVIGPNGVFHVESKNWAGEIRVFNDRIERSVKGNFHNPMEQIKDHHALLEALLLDNGIEADVVGILCFTNRRAQVMDIRGEGKSRRSKSGRKSDVPILVVRLHELAGTIRDYRPFSTGRSVKAGAEKQLKPTETARIARLIAANSRQHHEDSSI